MLVSRVLNAVALVGDSAGAAARVCAVTVGAVVDAGGVLVGAAHDLAGHPAVLAANTASHCVGAASWYRALLLLSPAVLAAVPIR